MGIADTLRDISHENLLNPAEKKSLRLIAKDVEQLQTKIKTYEDIFRWFRQRNDLIITASWLSHKTGISIKKILDWQDKDIEQPKDVY